MGQVGSYHARSTKRARKKLDEKSLEHIAYSKNAAYIGAQTHFPLRYIECISIPLNDTFASNAL